MGCCGKTIEKVKNIAIGYSNLVADIKFEFTDDRVRTCQKCDENTWLSGKEYTKWLLENGIKVITHLTELEKLPKLPKHELNKKRRNLYCRLCKCFIPAKARVKEYYCPLGKWKE